MKTGIVRRLDVLGRIVLPIEIRNAFGWKDKSKISIIQHDDYLILQTHHDSCCVCGNEQNIIPIQEKFVCQKCVAKLTKKK